MADNVNASTGQKQQPGIGMPGITGPNAAGHFAIAGVPVFIGAQQMQQGNNPAAGNFAIAGVPVFIGAQQMQQSGVSQSIPINTPTGGGCVNLNFFIGTSPAYQAPVSQPAPSTSGPTQTIDQSQTDIENQMEYLKKLREVVAQQLEQIEAMQMKLQQEKVKTDGEKKNQL